MQLRRKSLICAHTAAIMQAFKHKVYAAQFHFCLVVVVQHWLHEQFCFHLVDIPLSYAKWFITYNNNNIYLLQLGCHPVAVVILHVYRI